MGAALSRTTNETKDDITETKFPSIPILTPQIRKLEIDPRSPSTDICRTPIEVLKTPMNKNMTVCHKQRNILDLSGLDLDPRSPTLDFQRTPVVIKGETKVQPNHIHNKNLDNVSKPLISVTPLKPKTSDNDTNYDNKSEDMSPKLLETSTKFVKQIENKRNSFIGLLETNIDYIETDIDIAIQQKTSSQSTEIEKATETVELENIAAITETISEQNESTPIANELPNVETEDVTENIEESGDVTKCVAELDRKLTNLIYEDKVIESTVKISKPVEGHRTPLSDRNANNEHRRAIPVLKVNDRPTKMNKNSKIPVFKDKKIKGGHVQCENTPPTMIKRSHWSTEDSLII